MSDLVERLRRNAAEWSGDSWEAYRPLFTEAADEIERLRADIIVVREMAKFKEVVVGAVSPGQSVADIKQHLRTLKQDKADGSRESSAN